MNRSAFIAQKKRELGKVTQFELGRMWRLHKRTVAAEQKKRAKAEAAMPSSSSEEEDEEPAITMHEVARTEGGADGMTRMVTMASDPDINLAEITVTQLFAAPKDVDASSDDDDVPAVMQKLMDDEDEETEDQELRPPVLLTSVQDDVLAAPKRRANKRKSPATSDDDDRCWTQACFGDSPVDEEQKVMADSSTPPVTPQKKKRRKRTPKTIGQAMLSPEDRRKIQRKFSRRQRKARKLFFPEDAPPNGLDDVGEQILCCTDDSDASGGDDEPNKRWALVKKMRHGSDPDVPLPAWMPFSECEAKYPNLVKQYLKSPLTTGIKQYALWAGIL
jgi:hypothetical protein